MVHSAGLDRPGPSGEVIALQPTSMSLAAGDLAVIRGPSGAGKTSLLYTLAGLEKPNQGQVFIDGESLYELPRLEQAKVRKARMGYVFQSFFLDSRRS